MFDYAGGGELSDTYQHHGRCFDLNTAKFYAAEVFLALEYLQAQGIAHRDIKVATLSSV